MSGKHIDFAGWEPSDSLDEAHLEECAQCRQRHSLARFLKVSASAAPQLEPPPFFASRVAHRAKDQKPPFALLLGRAAKRLLPALALLVMVVAVSLVMTPQDLVLGDGDLALLLVESEQEVDVTMDDFILDLGESLQEVGLEREQ